MLSLFSVGSCCTVSSPSSASGSGLLPRVDCPFLPDDACSTSPMLVEHRIRLGNLAFPLLCPEIGLPNPSVRDGSRSEWHLWRVWRLGDRLQISATPDGGAGRICAQNGSNPNVRIFHLGHFSSSRPGIAFSFPAPHAPLINSTGILSLNFDSIPLIRY